MDGYVSASLFVVVKQDYLIKVVTIVWKQGFCKYGDKFVAFGAVFFLVIVGGRSNPSRFYDKVWQANFLQK